MLIPILTAIGHWAVPAVVLFIPLWGLFKGVKVYEAFIEGARQGLTTALRITPYLIAMLVSVRVFRVVGGMDLLAGFLSPLTTPLGVPKEVIPMCLIRPLSGTGSLAMLAELLKTHGPDSLVGIMASTIQGSTETTFYVVTVYFGAVKIRHIRHSLGVGLWADLAGFIAAICACLWLF